MPFFRRIARWSVAGALTLTLLAGAMQRSVHFHGALQQGLLEKGLLEKGLLEKGLLEKGPLEKGPHSHPFLAGHHHPSHRFDAAPCGGGQEPSKDRHEHRDDSCSVCHFLAHTAWLAGWQVSVTAPCSVEVRQTPRPLRFFPPAPSAYASRAPPRSLTAA